MQKTWETFKDMYQRELKKLHNTKSRQAAGTTHKSKWQYLMTVSFVNAVIIPQPTLSNDLAASSVLGSTPNLEDDKASANVSFNDTDNDESSEGVSDEHQVQKNPGTKRKINFQEEALYLEKRKIKLMEERLMKKSEAGEDKDYMFLMSLLTSIKILHDFQRLEFRVEFLSSVTRRIQIDKIFLWLLIVFPQHLTVCALQLHIRVQQVLIQHILWIQTLQFIHCKFLVIQVQIYYHVSFSSILSTYGVSLLRRRKMKRVLSTQLYILKNSEQIC